MKAVFKGYKAQGSYEFTVGKVYELLTDELDIVENEYVKVKDDSGSVGYFMFGSVYDFEVIEAKQVGIKHYINNNLVTKEIFDEFRSEVRELTIGGVKTSSINFEVKFE